MDVQEIGTRGLLFTFSPGINLYNNPEPLTFQIYVINAKYHLFICDTGLLKEQMEEVRNYFEENGLNTKPIVVFNTHHHTDHIGGNGIFDAKYIISHRLCKEKIVDNVEKIKENDPSQLEDKLITFPNLVFEAKFVFEDEGLEFFYSPGHSIDSASCYDRRDKVLVVGDNILPPFPLTTYGNLDKYKETLEKYQQMDVKKIIPGHNNIFTDRSIIQQTKEYVDQLQDISVDTSGFTPVQAYFLRWSLVNLAFYEDAQGNNKRVIQYAEYLKKMIEDSVTKPDNQEEMKYMVNFTENILNEEKEKK